MVVRLLRSFPLGYKKVVLFVALVLAEFLAGSVAVGLEPGLRADALGADGIYYGEGKAVFLQADRVYLAVPLQVVVLPDGSGLIMSTRLYTGTLTTPVRGRWQGNQFRGSAKSSFRFGPMLGETIEFEATYLKSSKSLIIKSRVISEGKKETTTYYKAETAEGKRYRSYWENPYSWGIPGRPFSRVIRDADRGQVAGVGEGLVGKFRVINPNNKSLFGRKSLILEPVNKSARMEGYTVTLMGAENFPRKIRTGEILRFTRDNPLIIFEPSSYNSFYVDLFAHVQDYKKPLATR